MAAADNIIFVNTNTNSVTLTLPAPTNGRLFRVKDSTGNAAVKNIVINPHSSETIDGSSSFTISVNYGAVDLYSDGTNWFLSSLVYAPIRGVIDASSAASGIVGEVLSQQRLRASRISITSGATTNILSTALTLTAGDWEISGAFALLPANTTTTSYIQAAISQTSASIPSSSAYAAPNSSGEIVIVDGTGGITTGGQELMTIFPSYQVNVSASTIFYLTANVGFAISTAEAYGSLQARRSR